LLALPIGAVTGLFLIPPMFVARRLPSAHYSMQGLELALALTVVVLALERHRAVRDRHTVLVAAGFAALFASTIAFGIALPASGLDYGESSYPFYAWLAAWLVAAVAFAAGARGGGWAPLRRLEDPRLAIGTSVAALGVIDLVLYAVEDVLPRVSPSVLASSDIAPYHLVTTGQAVATGVIVLMLGLAAWYEWRAVPADPAPRLLLAAAFGLGVSLVVLTLGRPDPYRPVVQPADAVSLLLHVLAVGAMLALGRGTYRGLRGEAESARDVTRTRSELATMVAHELINPLMSIKGLASTAARLYETMSDEERREFFQNIDVEAGHLKDIVTRTATALKIDAGQFPYSIREESLTSLVEQAVWVASLREHPILVEVEPNMVVECDRRRIEEVMGHLLENAARFSPPQEAIEVRAFRQDGEAVVEVADRGPGIPPDQRDHVFQKFGRYRPSGYEHVPGAGLSLFISRAHVEAHGGRMWVEGGQQGGTILRFTLPARDTTR
jgi:signal transduction histidine kinase